MVRAVFYTADNGALLGFRVQGHSGYAESGRDIVCAAVSSAALMAANTVTEVLHVPAQASVKDGDLRFMVLPKDAQQCRDVFLGFKLHMLSLEEQYPAYISVNYTEV